MSNKICCIFNYAPHYREEIYQKIDEEFNVDFYFGDIEEGKIVKIQDNVFNKPPSHLKTYKLLGSFNWISNSITLPFKGYDKYIITGEYLCLSTWVILLLNKLLGKSTYTWTHGWYGKETGVVKIIKKIYFSLPTANLLYGERAKELMLNEGFKENKLLVLYNSLHYEKQVKIRESTRKTDIFKKYFKNDYPVIIFTGRLTKIKKLDQLLDAQKMLFNNGNFVNVFILGDGPEVNKLKKWADDNRMNEYIYFYGSCYDENIIAELYYNAYCCVSPGNVGLTGIHAMTYGCPVISHNDLASQMPEFEVIKEGLNGCFFKKDDIKDLSLKVKLILDIDREFLRENSYKVIDEKFNTSVQLNLFRKILS